MFYSWPVILIHILTSSLLFTVTVAMKESDLLDD